MTERTILRKQQQEALRERQTAGYGESDDDSDSISTTSTQTSGCWDANKEYEVERILAERPGKESPYLIMWAGYPEEAASWEPESNILDGSVIDIWKARLAEEKAGKQKPFNVTAWEAKMERSKKEKEERRLRRGKKRLRRARKESSRQKVAQKPLPVADSDDEPLSGRRSKQRAAKPMQAVDDDDDEDDMPLAPRRKSSVDQNSKKNPKHTRKEVEEESESSSGDSLMAEIKEKEVRKRTTTRADRETTSKSKAKGVENVRNAERPNARGAILQRSTDSPAQSPQVRNRELPRPPSRTVSRDSVQETQPRSMSTNNHSTAGVAVPRGRGRTRGGRGAIRGGVRGGRAGLLPATSNVFAKSDNPKLDRRNLSNALNSTTANAETVDKTDLFKNLSHTRKNEKAARLKADRAPDLTVLGGLINPAEIKSSRTAYQQLKPQEPRQQPDGPPRRTSSMDAVPVNSAPSSRRSSTSRVRFVDDGEEASGHIFEEPGSIADNRMGRGNLNISTKGQMVNEQGNDQPDSPVQMKARPKSILRGPGILRTSSTNFDSQPSNESRAFQTPPQPRADTMPSMASTHTMSNQGQSAPAFPPQLQPRADTMPSMASSPIMSHQSPNSPAFQLPLQPRSDTSGFTATSNQIMPVRPISVKKKVSMSEYAARQGIEKGGNLVKPAIFGKPESRIQIAFNGIPRTSPEPWVKEIISLDAINFAHVCLSTHFQAQPAFLNAKILAHGNIAINADATTALDRVSEHLRLRLGGLIFCHRTTAILLFPTRLDEWKFLENTEVSNGNTLRYHIFQLPEFCSTINAPLCDTVSPQLLATPPYWSSAVDFLCALNYEALLVPLPPLTDKSKPGNQIQDRNNFFLLIPENATPSARFLTTWLKNCNPSCNVLSWQKDGSWTTFIQHVRKPYSAGTVLIHESFTHLIPLLPNLQRLFSSRCSYAILTISGCTAPQSSLSLEEPAPKPFVTTRLFPLGGAYFLAPSLLYADPKNVLKFLKWFRKRHDYEATPGTYKLVGCHNMRELMLDIANEKASERSEFTANFNAHSEGRDVELEATNRGLALGLNNERFAIHELIDNMMETAEAKLPAYFNLDEVDDDEKPVVYASEFIAQDDEPQMIEWFAGWAMQNLAKYRRFWVLGTDPSNIARAVPWIPSHNVTETPVTGSTDAAHPVSPNSPFDNNVRWKRSGFAAVTEVASAPLYSTVVPISQPDMREVAVEHYRQDFPDLYTSSHIPQLDGAANDFGGAGHNSTSGSRSTSRPSSRSGVIMEEDGRRVVPASPRGDGSTRPEIPIKPGYVSPEDKERPVEDGLRETVRRDESGDVVMGENDNHDATSNLPPPQLPRGAPTLAHATSGDAVMRGGETCSSAVPASYKGSESSDIFASEYERSRSPSKSPTNSGMLKSRSSLSIEATTQWYRRKDAAGQAWGHIRVLGLQEAFTHFGLPYEK